MKKEVVKKAKGFIQGILLFGIALMAVVIGAFALSGRDSKKSTSAEEDKANAAAVLSQGNILTEAIDRMLSDRPLVTTYDFGTSAFSGSSIGLFNTTDGYAVSQTLPAKTFTNNVQTNTSASGNSAGSWGLNTNVTMDSGKVHIIYVDNIKEGVCRRINSTLYNINALPTTSKSLAFNSQTPLSLVSSDVNGSGTYTEGCIYTGTSATRDTAAVPKYGYFKVVYRP